jgi:acyl-CoA dehydrogenase
MSGRLPKWHQSHPTGETQQVRSSPRSAAEDGGSSMIDFTFSPEVEEVRLKVRRLMDEVVRPEWESIDQHDRGQLVSTIVKLRKVAKEDWGIWLPHMPKEWGGMALGPTAMAAVSAEAAKVGIGPFVINAQAPDEGNQHTLEHWGTPEQKEKYLRPLCEGTTRSCFAMTEPEVAGSDPTLIQTRAYQDGDEWVINGHKWFISGARGAKFAILIARTEDDPDIPQAANTAFIVDLPSEGWEIVRDVHTMSGGHNHCEIRITDLRVHKDQMLGGQGQGHLLGQYRLGPARLAHCMRWIAQCETALDMMVARSLERYSHGSLLAEKQGIQWMIADSAMEMYQCKLMVLHAAYKIENKMDFTSEVSMAKHFVANSLWRIIDRAIQVHGALGYSTDTPLAGMLQQARWSRFADGADEIHQMRIAQRTIAAYKDWGTTKKATGDLPL